MKRQGQQVDVSVFVIGVNEAGAIEVLVYVTVADGSVAPADVLLDVVMVRAASLVFRKYYILCTYWPLIQHASEEITQLCTCSKIMYHYQCCRHYSHMLYDRMHLGILLLWALKRTQYYLDLMR